MLQSFKNAINGLFHAFKSERNMKIHVAVTVLLIIAGLVLGLEPYRWVALFFAIGLVLVCELINTSIEKLTDMVTSEYSDEAGRVKDISASAVLVSAVISVIVGVIVFLDPICNLLGFIFK